MYKCEKYGRQTKPGVPQSKINNYRKDGSIESEKKVCFYCKEKEEK